MRVTAVLVTFLVASAALAALATPGRVAAAQSTPVIPPGAVVMDGTPAGLPAGGVAVTTSYALVGEAPTSQGRAEVRPDSASGCLNIDAWRNEYTLLGFLAYRWHVTDYFCWSNSTVTSTSTGYYVSDNDGFEFFNGLAGTNDYYYVYFSGIAHSGHYTYREASMSNCVWDVCLSVQYPWVSITVHGDGSWTYSYGG